MDRDFVVVISSELTPGRLEVHYRVCAHVDDLYVRVIGVAAFCSEGFPWLLASGLNEPTFLPAGRSQLNEDRYRHNGQRALYYRGVHVAGTYRPCLLECTRRVYRALRPR